MDAPELGLTPSEKADLSDILFSVIKTPTYDGSMSRNITLKKKYNQALSVTPGLLERVTTVIVNGCRPSNNGPVRLSHLIFSSYVIGKLSSSVGLGWKLGRSECTVHFRLETTFSQLKKEDFSSGDFIVCKSDQANLLIFTKRQSQANKPFAKFAMSRDKKHRLTHQVRQLEFKNPNEDLNMSKKEFEKLVTLNTGVKFPVVADNDSNYFYRTLSIELIKQIILLYPEGSSGRLYFTHLKENIGNLHQNQCMWVIMSAYESLPVLKRIIDSFYVAPQAQRQAVAH